MLRLPSRCASSRNPSEIGKSKIIHGPTDSERNSFDTILQMEAELMAREHEAMKKSASEVLKLAAADLDKIVRKFESIKSPKNGLEDKTTFSKMLNEAKENFERLWTSRKLILTREAKFRIFLSESEAFSVDLDRVSDTLNIRTSPEESSASVNAAMKFIEQLEATQIKVKQLNSSRGCMKLST